MPLNPSLDLQNLSASSQRRRTVMAVVAPLVAICLVALLTALFLWLTTQEQKEEQQLNLMRDTLWVEQTLRFQISSHESNLSSIASDLANAANTAQTDAAWTRARYMVNHNAEVLQITWRDLRGELLKTFPFGHSSDFVNSALLDRALQHSMAGGAPFVPFWDSPQQQDKELMTVLTLPLSGASGELIGFLQARLSLNALITSHVPWWIAENYQIALTDVDGFSLVNKSNLRNARGMQHLMSFDPPFHGVFLKVTQYETTRNPLQTILIAGIIALAVLAAMTMGMLYLHLRRRQQAESALRSEQLFRKAMQDSITVGMRARGLDGRMLFANPAFCRMVGWSAEDIIGMTPPMPWWPSEMLPAIYERHARQHKIPKAHSFETTFVRRDGASVQVMVYEAPLIDESGTHVGWMASIIDISDRRAAEALASQQADRLQQTGRLITMGEMASTLAHELNQPLAAITSYSTSCQNLLEHEKPDIVAIRKILGNLSNQTRRAGLIIKHIHNFVRKRDLTRKVCDLNQLVSDTISFARSDAIRQGVELEFVAGQQSMWVNVDPVLIEQVLLNLIRNAMEATLETGNLRHEVKVSVQHDEQTDRYTVSVADTGKGIPPEMMERIFMPFVTTKSAGMGMGLNICSSILEQHEGHLWFMAGDEQGAVFIFSLPRHLASDE